MKNVRSLMVIATLLAGTLSYANSVKQSEAELIAERATLTCRENTTQLTLTQKEIDQGLTYDGLYYKCITDLEVKLVEHVIVVDSELIQIYDQHTEKPNVRHSINNLIRERMASRGYAKYVVDPMLRPSASQILSAEALIRNWVILLMQRNAELRAAKLLK